MDFKWFFQKYSGTPRFPTINPDDAVHDSKEHLTNDKIGDLFDHSFHDPFEDFGEGTRDIFQHVEDMFNRVLSASFRPFEFSQIEECIPNKTDPRNIMLKESNWSDYHPNTDLSPCKPNESGVPVDSDIDDKITEQGLFQMNPFAGNRGSHNSSFRKFSSVKTVRFSDGAVEEHHTITDSKGNKITAIRQSIGDQSYEVTTKFDERGLKEKRENFENMDEKDLPEFEKKLNDIKGNKILESSSYFPSRSDILKLPMPAADPVYLSLFKRFFLHKSDK